MSRRVIRASNAEPPQQQQQVMLSGSAILFFPTQAATSTPPIYPVRVVDLADIQPVARGGPLEEKDACRVHLGKEDYSAIVLWLRPGVGCEEMRRLWMPSVAHEETFAEMGRTLMRQVVQPVVVTKQISQPAASTSAASVSRGSTSRAYQRPNTRYGPRQASASRTQAGARPALRRIRTATGKRPHRDVALAGEQDESDMEEEEDALIRNVGLVPVTPKKRKPGRPAKSRAPVSTQIKQHTSKSASRHLMDTAGTSSATTNQAYMDDSDSDAHSEEIAPSIHHQRAHSASATVRFQEETQSRPAPHVGNARVEAGRAWVGEMFEAAKNGRVNVERASELYRQWLIQRNYGDAATEQARNQALGKLLKHVFKSKRDGAVNVPQDQRRHHTAFVGVRLSNAGASLYKAMFGKEAAGLVKPRRVAE